MEEAMINKIKYEKKPYTREQYASLLKVSASLWTLLSFILGLGVLFVFFGRSTGSLRKRFPRNFWPLFQSELLFLKISRYLLATLEYIGKTEKGQFFSFRMFTMVFSQPTAYFVKYQSGTGSWVLKCIICVSLNWKFTKRIMSKPSSCKTNDHTSSI